MTSNINLHFTFLYVSGSKAVDILEAYEGTLEDDYPPENERCEHGEMLLYKVMGNIYVCFRKFCCSVCRFHLIGKCVRWVQWHLYRYWYHSAAWCPFMFLYLDGFLVILIYFYFIIAQMNWNVFGDAAFRGHTVSILKFFPATNPSDSY